MFDRFMVGMIRRMARKRLGKDIAPLQTIATHPGVLVPYAKFNQALNETNRLELYVFASAKYPQALLVARLDNLGKGASGAAVQNMRLMLGFAD